MHERDFGDDKKLLRPEPTKPREGDIASPSPCYFELELRTKSKSVASVSTKRSPFDSFDFLGRGWNVVMLSSSLPPSVCM